MDLMESRKAILALLDEHKIDYQYYEHDRAHTIDDCLKMPFITNDVTICKNILLCNRQQTSFYLLLLRPLTPFRTSVVSKALGVSRLSFAPENTLEEKMHLTSGSVCPFGLCFDTESQITLCYEEAIKNTKRIAFHPCDNAATVAFEQKVFWEQVVPLLNAKTIGIEVVENI